jgi:hypothetical protein
MFCPFYIISKQTHFDLLCQAPSFEPESARMTSGATTATGGRSEFGLHDLSALKMALEDVMAPPEQLR